MPDPHLFQHVAGFVVAMWWTKQWLVRSPVSKWRFAVTALSGAILWVFVAYTATRSVAASGGETVVFQSMALAYFAVFMAFASVIGIFLGFALWAEEEGERASENIPENARSHLGGD